MILDQVISRLKTDEGFVPYVYLDARGFSTLGYGFCVDRRAGMPIPSEIAEEWLSTLATSAQTQAESYQWWAHLNDARQNIIVCLMFNLGKPVFDTFIEMQAALASGDWQAAANELQNSAWFTQVGVRGPIYVNTLATGIWPKDDSA